MTTEAVHILYVDDEADIRSIVEFALEDEEGLALELCTSGQEALAKASQLRPNLILLDVMMPGMDGPTTLQRLRDHAELATTPVVFITAKVQPQEIAHFKSIGAVDVIAKPFDPMALADQIREIWRRCRNE